jgi:two-component system, NtrC family, nitrogen regulation sensor histidine kinase NtrY
MNLSRSGNSVLNWVRTRRYYYIVFFIIAVLIILELSRAMIVFSIKGEWDSIRDKQAEKEADIIYSAFNNLQNRVYGIAARASDLLTADHFDLSPATYFTLLRSINIGELQGIEVYDRIGKPIAWWGRIPGDGIAGTETDEPYTFVTQGTVFTTLTAVIPVHNEQGEINFRVAAHEVFDVRYTLSPRFIRMQGLQHDLRQALGKPVQINYQPGFDRPFEIELPLYGIDGSTLGFAVFSGPTLEAYISEVEELIHIVRTFLVIIISLFVIAGIVGWLEKKQFPFFLVVISIVAIWGIRYFWMFLNIPGAIIGGSPFDPAYYASPHGGGVVASPGDLLITTLLLVVTGLFLFHSIVINNSLKIPKRYYGIQRATMLFVSCAVMLIQMGLVRAYAASVRSFVFDSSVRFTDPGSLLPSPMLALMQFNLLVFTAAFVILGTVLGYISLRLVQASFHRSLFRSSNLLFLIIMITSVCYYYPQNTPLVGLWYYISVPVILITITLLVQKGYLQSFRLYKIRSILFLTGVSVIFAAPVLDRTIHKFDREQIQFIANNLIRPTDAWKEFILLKSLREFTADDELIHLLEERNAEAIRKKAFRLWAGSLLGREGYNTTLVISDRHRNPVTRFGIGFQPPEEITGQDIDNELPSEETIIRNIETMYGSATLYTSEASVYNDIGEHIGYVTVNVITGPGTLFRGWGTDILSIQISPDITARYGQLIISEFQNKDLVSTSALNIPVLHTVPETVLLELEENDPDFVWHREEIESRLYETVYFKDPDSGTGTYFAVSLPRLDFRWHIFYTLKLIFFALSVSGLLLIAAGVVFYAQGKRYQPTFREKILIGLLSIALVPIIVVAYLNRDFTIERMTENISSQLFEEAKRVEVQLKRYIHPEDDTSNINFPQSIAERVAGELGIDFILYVDEHMSITSRMEMFEAELMDRRLSGYAYRSIILEGKNYITREEAIGQSSYLVGYMPLHDEHNDITGVLAVPAIYRQAEIDEELARRDAFLFGIYAVIMLGVIITGLIVANQFARPIEELTEATHKVAGGTLDIDLPSKGDSEMSNLIRSFNVMTKRLKDSREELARVERELAWREMARQVAHEIKNPLTPMKLSIQQLRQTRKDGSGDFDTSFDIITRMLLEQIDTLDRIASEFSRFARMPAAHYKPVQVNAVIKRALTVFPDKNGIDFQTKFDDTIPVIIADPEELQRAFVNIFRNSIQAMPDGGIIDVTTKLEHEQLKITITDNGTGIPPAVRNRLFEPNFSTKTDGMGLGLAIVRKTIEELNGTVHITSEMEKGTTVAISIPIRTKPDSLFRKELL